MKNSIKKVKTNTNKKILFLIIIFIGIIIYININKYILLIDGKDLIIAKKYNPEIGNTVCFYEYGNLKISRIIRIREDGSYVTKMDNGICYDQSKIYTNDIKGTYCGRVKYIIGILKSKITLSIFLIILVYMLYELNNSKKKSAKRKMKKEEMS